MGVKDKLTYLHGIALDNYLKHWKEWIKSECEKRGITVEDLGYSLATLEGVKQFLLDYCDDLTDSECREAIIEAIKEHGGVITPEEEYHEVPVMEELPCDILEEIESDVEHMKEMGYPPSEIYERVLEILQDYEVPNAEILASKMTGYKPSKKERERKVKVEEIHPIAQKWLARYYARKSKASIRKVSRKSHKAPTVAVYDALSKYVLHTTPTIRAKPVSGVVHIGLVNGHYVYLIVESDSDIVRVIKVTPNSATVEVAKGWIEVY